MGGIGRAIGAVLTGAGEGLEKQALSDIQTRREIALENLRHGNRMDEQVGQYDLADRNAGRDDARGFGYTTATKEQEHGYRVTEKSVDHEYDQENIRLKGTVDLQNDKTIEGLKHQYNLSEQAADDARQLDHDLKVAHITADHWEVTRDGKLVALNSNGQVISSSSNADSYVPTRTSESSTDDDAGATIGGAAAARGKGSQAKSKPTGQPDKSVLGQLSRMPPPPDGQVGRTMTGPNGLKARWNGKQWVLLDVNG